MIEIIGNDSTKGPKKTSFKCKCEACGCIFTAGLDDADLGFTSELEYQLIIRCPVCKNALIYKVKEE